MPLAGVGGGLTQSSPYPLQRGTFSIDCKTARLHNFYFSADIQSLKGFANSLTVYSLQPKTTALLFFS
jgi:hypothetical protein